MRFNTDRSGRLAFGDLVNDYDRGRRRLDPAFVRGVRRRLAADATADGAPSQQRAPTQHVLEVGAGTGQLTAALLGSGDVVTAVEPSGLLRTRLE